MTLTVKQHDTRPPLRLQLYSGGAPIDVTADVVTLVRVRRSDGVAVPLGGVVTKVTPATGVVEYSWATGDNAVPGVYDFECVLVGPTGTQRVPTVEPIRVEVLPALA